MPQRFAIDLSHDVYDAITYHAKQMGLPRTRLIDALLRQALKFDRFPEDAIETSRLGGARSKARLPELEDLPFLKKHWTITHLSKSMRRPRDK